MVVIKATRVALKEFRVVTKKINEEDSKEVHEEDLSRLRWILRKRI